MPPAGVRAGDRVGPAERLSRRADFARLRRGARGGDAVVRVQVVRNGLDWTRVASAVPRRFGPAVRRNRLRRLYREAFRLEKAALPAGLDLLLSPPRGAAIPTLAELRASLVRTVRQAAGRLKGKPRAEERR